MSFRVPPPSHRARRGYTLPDVAAGTAATALLAAVAIPAFARAGGDARTTTSLDNLRSLGVAHAVYATDWNDRQLTLIDDTISTLGGPTTAFDRYEDFFGERHPPITLGWGVQASTGDVRLFAYRTNGSFNARLTEPIVFESDPIPGVVRLGSHRFINTQQFAAYLDGRFYDDVFYAASDPTVQPIVDPLHDSPWPYADTGPVPGVGDVPFFSSYTMSAAAMFNPTVMAAPGKDPDAGWKDPWSRPDGFRAPSLSAAKYAHLKTLMLEHHWLQNAPADPCNPNFVNGTYDGCEPYYFNHGLDSSPGTLFYDGATRLFANTEAKAADDLLRAGGGPGTWHRETPLGETGYFNEIAFDDVDLAHHVLTVDGVLGRDTLDPGAVAGRSRAARRPAASRGPLGTSPKPARRPTPFSRDLSELDSRGGDA